MRCDRNGVRKSPRGANGEGAPPRPGDQGGEVRRWRSRSLWDGPRRRDQRRGPSLRRQRGGGPRKGRRPNAYRADPAPREGRRRTIARSRDDADPDAHTTTGTEDARAAQSLAQVSRVGSSGVSLRSIFSGFFSPTANSCKYGIRLPTIRFSAFRRCSSYVDRLTPRLRAMFSVVTSRGEV